MNLFDLIIIGVLVFFIVTRFTSNPMLKDKKKEDEKDKKSKKPIEIKVIQGSAQTKEQIEKIFQKAREMSEVENQRAVDKESLDGLTRIKAYDESFSTENFLKGAKSAFNWFYEFINKDDDAGLEKLVSPKIFAEMVNWLNDLDDKKQIANIDVEFEKDPEIVDCRTVAKTAFIDVKYNVTLKTTIKDKESEKVDSQETKKENVIWTWAKNITSTDPNWQLDEIKYVS